MNLQRSVITNVIHIIFFLGVIVLSAYLRLYAVGDNPAWYTDEATHVEIAQNILSGEVRYFAVTDSWLIFARLPLFEYLLAGIFSLFGVGMSVLRLFTGSLGVFTTILLYFTIRDCGQNRWLGLLVSYTFAVLPSAVLYNRMGFSYNLLLPLIVIIFWSSYRYRASDQRNWLVLFALCIGLGCISDVIMWSFLPLILFITWGLAWRDILFALIIAFLPFSIYASYALVTHSDAFLFDLGYTLARTSGSTPVAQAQLIIQNYQILLTHWWWVVGIMGVVLVDDKPMRYVIAVMFLPMLIVGRTVPLYSLSAYYLLPFLPLLAIGVGNFCWQMWHFISGKVDSLLGRVLIVVLVVVPLFISSVDTIHAVNTGFATEIDAFLVDAEDAHAVADFINQRATEDDLIVASAPIGWLLDGDISEFQMTAIYDGRDAIHIPSNLPRERLAFETNIELARYVVVDNLWRNWGAVHIPQIMEILAELASWEMVYEVGAIQVFENSRIAD